MDCKRYLHAGEEPTLFEMLADPTVHAVMRRDGVTGEELMTLLRYAAAVIDNGQFRHRKEGSPGAYWPVSPAANPSAVAEEPAGQCPRIDICPDQPSGEVG